jgi:hypothetical protein
MRCRKQGRSGSEHVTALMQHGLSPVDALGYGTSATGWPDRLWPFGPGYGYVVRGRWPPFIGFREEQPALSLLSIPRCKCHIIQAAMRRHAGACQSGGGGVISLSIPMG